MLKEKLAKLASKIRYHADEQDVEKLSQVVNINTDTFSKMIGPYMETSFERNYTKEQGINTFHVIADYMDFVRKNCASDEEVIYLLTEGYKSMHNHMEDWWERNVESNMNADEHDCDNCELSGDCPLEAIMRAIKKRRE
jgi:hypothetical protein